MILETIAKLALNYEYRTTRLQQESNPLINFKQLFENKFWEGTIIPKEKIEKYSVYNKYWKTVDQIGKFVYVGEPRESDKRLILTIIAEDIQRHFIDKQTAIIMEFMQKENIRRVDIAIKMLKIEISRYKDVYIGLNECYVDKIIEQYKKEMR